MVALKRHAWFAGIKWDALVQHKWVRVGLACTRARAGGAAVLLLWPGCARPPAGGGGMMLVMSHHSWPCATKPNSSSVWLCSARP